MEIGLVVPGAVTGVARWWWDQARLQLFEMPLWRTECERRRESCPCDNRLRGQRLVRYDNGALASCHVDYACAVRSARARCAVLAATPYWVASSMVVPGTTGWRCAASFFAVFTLDDGEIVHLRDYAHRGRCPPDAGRGDHRWR
jgi:hypothetical protein